MLTPENNNINLPTQFSQNEQLNVEMPHTVTVQQRKSTKQYLAELFEKLYNEGRKVTPSKQFRDSTNKSEKGGLSVK